MVRCLSLDKTFLSFALIFTPQQPIQAGGGAWRAHPQVPQPRRDQGQCWGDRAGAGRQRQRVQWVGAAGLAHL